MIAIKIYYLSGKIYARICLKKRSQRPSEGSVRSSYTIVMKNHSMSAPISPRRSCNNTNNTSEYVSENQRIGLRLIYDLLFVYCQVICAKGESWLNSSMSFFFLCYPMKILFMHIHKQFEQFLICFVHRSFICYNCSHVFLRTALCALPSN